MATAITIRRDTLLESDSVKIQSAIALLLDRISHSPRAVEIYLELGNLYVRQQQWQQAQATYRQAIALDPDCVLAHRQLAAVFAKLNNTSQSANHLFKAFQLQPVAVTAMQHYKLGQTLKKQDKPAMAIACYRNAIESQPDFWLAYVTLFTSLEEQGKKKRAIEVYRQGVRHNPQDWRYYFALASALYTRQKWVRACNNYQQAAKLKPSAEVYYHWGLALEQLKEYSQAGSCFEKATQLKPSAEIYYHWGLALSQLQEYSAAESCYEQAIALKADYAPAYYQLGRLQQDRTQWLEAIALYQKAITLNPQHGSSLLHLAEVYRHLQQYDLAINSYHQALNCLPDSSLETVLVEYQQVLAEYPESTAQQYYQLAKSLRAKGCFSNAIAAYQKAIELDPHFKKAYIDLQYTPVTKEQSNQQIEFYRQIVTEHPNITIAWGNLGDALTQQDRVAEAIECYRTASYRQAIQSYPYLAKLHWKPRQETGPDFIIAGASKCGTSSIHYYLSCHRQILLSHKKEIDFYWQHYHRGIDWYRAHFPTISDRADFLTGEATPNYLRFPQIASRIKDTFPQTKIIILLRNPVDRAISWHYHKLNAGLTNVDLKTAIATEIEKLATVTEAEIINTGYGDPDNIMSSLYIYKIKPWIELLGREQFLILKSEEFYSNPLQVMSDVFQFLDLPDYPLNNYPKVNAGSYQPTDPELRNTIAEYFAPYNRQLEEYLGMEFGWE